MIKIPPYLKKGDTIGITCPAGYMAKEKAQTCIDTLQSWGYQVMVGKTLGSQSKNYFSGDDEQRRNELQAMLDDDSINAILCGRGGYGVSRIIDQIDLTKFKKKPKWIIGYSDITVLHCHLNQKLKIASMHAPMAAAFNDGPNEFIQSLQKAITGKKGNYKCAAHELNRKGKVSGELVGGNLALLVNIIGTASDINTKNKILFIEDIGEYIYSVDRMMYQLKRSGKLDDLAGLIIGGFTDIKDTERPFGKTVYEAINDIVKKYNYPICFGFPVGHSKENYALKVGVDYELTISNKQVRLSEI
ncbi:S66 peptidase family protein [Ferruginibacter sp. SUN002]|uniref:S66 peptidase family protein n=1 Tax=Ferruginibacter sp. SUN002 TaxID=2937789 RepID=UPI003D3659FD